jgi:hypothetical protein
LLGDHFPLLFGKSFKLIFSALETINSLLEEARKAADDGFNYGPIGELIGYLRAARDTKHDLQRMLGL